MLLIISEVDLVESHLKKQSKQEKKQIPILKQQTFYNKSINAYSKESLITDNLSFEKYLLSSGNTNLNGSFSVINYFRILKTATKIETIQNWNETPTQVNSTAFVDIKIHSSFYKFSATTYFNLPINLDFGFNYN